MTPTMKNTLATAYGVDADEARLYTSAPTSTAAGTEVTGGTYAPKAITWSAPSSGVITASVTFDVPAGVTVRGAGVHRADGTYLDGGALTDQPYASAGTYTLSLTYTQS